MQVGLGQRCYYLFNVSGNYRDSFVETALMPSLENIVDHQIHIALRSFNHLFVSCWKDRRTCILQVNNSAVLTHIGVTSPDNSTYICISQFQVSFLTKVKVFFSKLSLEKVFLLIKNQLC